MLSGVLDNQTDPNFRPISPNVTVFALSRDLGPIQATEDPVIWAVGLTMDAVINYTALSGAAPQQRSLFYKIRYSDDKSLVSVHIHGDEHISRRFSDH